MAVISYKCPNCGGELRFDPKTQKYKCEYCLSYFDEPPKEDEVKTAEPGAGGEEPKAPSSDGPGQSGRPSGEDRKAGAAGTGQSGRAGGAGGDVGADGDEAPGQGAVVYTCPSCGAELVTDATTAATFCYYCHNPVILEGRLSGKYLPDRVIPFKLDKKKAVEEFLSFVKKKKFVPKAFFNRDQIEKLTGVYYPYWVCSAKGTGSIRAEARNFRVWRAGDTEFTETSVYAVEREGDLGVKDLMKGALKKADHQLAQGVWPYNLEEEVPFVSSYLAGFQAEKRDLERKDLETEVQAELREYAEKALRDSIQGYQSVELRSCDIHADQEDWSYVLLPVWVLTYRDRAGKHYYYAMNGQTGNFAGVLPIDWGKVAGLFFAVAIPVLAIFLAGGYFL